MGAALGASMLDGMTSAVSEGRQRGRIERRGNALRVVVYSGDNP